LFDKGKLSYIFERKGKRFGNMVKVNGRKPQDIVNGCIALVFNAVETIDAADKL